ncbi:MAG: tRNA uridine-5-carboxymethylaminomethyl(34) synthesis GTPase MnmE [Sumerlaeia bacterium]
MARPLVSASNQDTIAARATAPGEGAIAVVRLSGPRARAIGARLFRPASAAQGLDRVAARQAVFGELILPGERAELLDQAVATVWHGPHSYTGEDVVEFSIHGARVIVERLIGACVAEGARLAAPGEFTRRAFENGKLDLAQAEAVCDLIRSQTEAAGRAALAQLSGGLSRRLEGARQSLVPVVAELEAHVDFPDEGLEIATRERLSAAVEKAAGEIETLLESAGRGMALRDGARVVLAGRPNAGKSSLFNLLLRRERAIVSPHAGTTRDTVEAQVDLGGVAVTLVDTAGLREGAGEIEAIGIARTREELASADLVLFLADCTEVLGATRREYDLTRAIPHIVVANKADAGDALALESELKLPARRAFVALSVATRAGFEDLEAALIREVAHAASGEQGALVTNRRHVRALETALEALRGSLEGLASDLSAEFVVVDLTEAIAQLDAITGRQGLDEDVLDQIFSTFCLGK